MNLKSKNLLRHMQYAIGEVILIIIGTMIALYLDNWSNRKDKAEAFDTALSQICTNLQMEKGWYQLFEASYEKRRLLRHRNQPNGPDLYLHQIAGGW